jgi:hypothetical protein
MIKHKLHQVCDNDSTGPALQYVKNTGRHYIATNGHAMAIVPAQDEIRPGLVPAKVFKEAAKGKKDSTITQTDDGFVVTQGDNKAVIEKSDETPGSYPNYLPLYKRTRQAIKSPVFRLGINAKILLDLQNALGSDTLVLHFDAAGFCKDDNSYTGQIAVTTPDLENTEVTGLIMPCKVY